MACAAGAALSARTTERGFRKDIPRVWAAQ